MRIGIDARELTGHPTGVGRYLSGLLREWHAHPGAHEFVLYAHRLPLNPGLSPFAIQVLAGKGGTVWEQATLARGLKRDRVDAFFSPGYTTPLLSGVPTTVAIHDVSFCAHPEWFSPREGARRRFLTKRSAAMARAVITISEFSRGEIVRHLDVEAGKVRVIPPGIDPPASARTTAPADDPRILFVGSIFNRRHVPDLIAATGALAGTHPSVSLDIVGDNRSRPHVDVGALIANEQAKTQIRWHRYVDEPTLQALYGRARAFAFLSEYEGLGLTPLEGLSIGVPPVLLDTPVARESCGDAALYVRRGDIAGTASALGSMLFDETTRARLLGAAPTVLRRFDWPTAARQTLAAITGA